jgi:hypothetical protein
MRILYAVTLFLFFVLPPSSAQPELSPCGTPPLSGPERRDLSLAFQHFSSTDRANARLLATALAIKVHIVLNARGEGDVAGYLQPVLAVLNTKFAPIGVSFFQLGAVNYLRSDELYDLAMSEDKALTAAHNVHNAINLYFVGSADGSNGYAYPPSLDSAGNTRAWNALFISTKSTLPPAQVIQEVIPHEMGHYFGLLHTHEWGTENNLDSATREYVTRGPETNCSVAGDQLCDTPADPYLLLIASERQLAQTVCSSSFFSTLDPRREVYRPDVNNLMSYYRGCRTSFTPQQYERMRWGLTLRNKLHPNPDERYFLDGQVRLFHERVSGTSCAGAALEVLLRPYGELETRNQFRIRLTGATNTPPLEVPAAPVGSTRLLRATLPAELASGTYTLQVVATLPAVVSAGTSLTVVGKPVVSAEQTGGRLVLRSSSSTGNQWYLNGTPLPDSTRQYLLPAAAGSYTVQVQQGTCRKESDAFVLTATEPAPSPEVVLYPNPNQGTFRVELPGWSGPWQAEVLTQSGQQVYQKFFPAGTSRGDTIELRAPAGTYVLRMTFHGHSVSRPFRVE